MNETGFWHFLLGDLSWGALPYVRAWRDPVVSEIIGAGAGMVVILGFLLCVTLITYLKAWKYLWSEWFTSLDHKRIGTMYMILAVIMFTRALIEAVLMRTQQAFAVNSPGFVEPNHFAQLFSTHGSIMIFFMGMPLLTGLINYVMPLQIGSRDMAFPYLNSVGLWLSVGGSILMMASLTLGEFSTGGWSGYPPYTELNFSGGPGPDYWIWAVSMSTLGSTVAGLNFICTIYKFRAPGMTFMRMPLFCWTSLCTAVLMVFAMPALTVATLLLAADRYAGMHFFTDDLGGNMMNYVQLFWLFGHPEVYILVLPAFGVYSEVISTFSSKELYGYISLVVATVAIAVLSFTVWLHHFFTMGQSANINAVFGIATMTIGIPTGVKIYDWIFTMFRGEVRMTPSMVLSVAFMLLFVLGGFTGIILATPPLDYMTHNTLFLVAHFHNMLIPGLLYGMIAGYMFWFPKMFGFRLNERWGWISAGCFIVGFCGAFFPLYALGAAGMARRTQEVFDPAFRPWLIVALGGAFIVLLGLASLFIQLYVSIRDRRFNMVTVGDPWDARSLEWSIASPPPQWNYAVIPHVSSRDAFYWRKRNHGAYHPADHYEDIEVPKNSACGLIVGMACSACFFGLIWRIWWLAIAGALLVVVTAIARSFMRNVKKIIPAAEVEAADRRWLAQVGASIPAARQFEMTERNEGLAKWMA